MLRDADAPATPLTTETLTISIAVQPDDAAHPFRARCDKAPWRPGATRRDAVTKAIEEAFGDEPAVLAL